MRKIFLFILIALILTGCGSKEDPIDNNVNNENPVQSDVQNEDKQDNTQKEPSGYAFKHNGVSIYMNSDVLPVIEALGDYNQYFESESCAFKGLDKFYTYSAFEITTYPLGDKDLISSVYLMDDTVSTPEGIYLGATVDDMIEAYGDDYVESAGSYTYIMDDSKLQIIAKDNEIISITYLANVEGIE